MERVTRRRVERLAAGVQDWALRQEMERVAAEVGCSTKELLDAAQKADTWCRRYRLQHGVRWVGDKIDIEPECRAYAVAHGLDPEELVATTQRRVKAGRR